MEMGTWNQPAWLSAASSLRDYLLQSLVFSALKCFLFLRNLYFEKIL